MILSFGWTWPAFVAKAKTCTRRDWKPSHREDFARIFERGEEIQAWTHVPYAGGEKMGILKLTEHPRFEAMKEMPDLDYQAEGFKWFSENPWAIPDGAKQETWAKGDCSFSSFEEWRKLPLNLTVVRFEILSVLPKFEKMLMERKLK